LPIVLGFLYLLARRWSRPYRPCAAARAHDRGNGHFRDVFRHLRALELIRRLRCSTMVR
jgi:hypothetical protein